MPTTPRKSKLAFNFTTTPDSDDAQYARKEMEKLSQYLITLIEDLQNTVSKISVSPSVDFSKQIEAITKQITNILNAISGIPIVNVDDFLKADDLFPITVPTVFTRTITINVGQTAVFFDGTVNAGDITNDGVILVL